MLSKQPTIFECFQSMKGFIESVVFISISFLSSSIPVIASTFEATTFYLRTTHNMRMDIIFTKQTTLTNFPIFSNVMFNFSHLRPGSVNKDNSLSGKSLVFKGCDDTLKNRPSVIRAIVMRLLREWFEFVYCQENWECVPQVFDSPHSPQPTALCGRAIHQDTFLRIGIEDRE